MQQDAFRQYCRQLSMTYPFNGKILFVQIPQVILDSFNMETARAGGYYIFPPTGLQYLFSAINQRDFDVRILDLNFEILKRVHLDPTFDPLEWAYIFRSYLEDFQPSIIGISCLFDVGISPMMEALKISRDYGRAILIGGGVIATYEWKKLLGDDLCHFVVKGEGEEKINYLLDNITNNSMECRPTAGILFRDGELIRETTGRDEHVPFHGDLIDSYRLVPISEYYKYGSLNPFSRRVRERVPFAAIQLSRGCRGCCSFCSVRDFMGKGVRCRPLQDIVAEMEYLVKERGVRHFELLDDDPTFCRETFVGVLNTIIDRKWPIHWSANNGMIAASLDRELLTLMELSGCIGFKIGIETGNPDMLKKIRKPATHDKILAVSRMLDDFPEIFVGGNYIVGFPGETFGLMLDTFKFALEVRLDWAALTVCQIIRGASAFADSGEYFEAQMVSGGHNVQNFIPSRETTDGTLRYDGDVRKGLDIFSLSFDDVPNREQVKEIWFTFNLLANYIFNKNLEKGGNPGKFIAWVEKVILSYPVNPYMNLFAGIAHILEDNIDTAIRYKQKASELIGASEYWQGRFDHFGLMDIVNDFPKKPEAVYGKLRDLRYDISQYFTTK